MSPYYSNVQRASVTIINLITVNVAITNIIVFVNFVEV